VLARGATDGDPLAQLLARYGLILRRVADGDCIPGSYWGASEAGLRGRELYARADTPVHSVLHEASHFVCMSPARRAGLDRDAGGTDLEEAAVCYLQILLADELAAVGRARMMHDMDTWGYSFRPGSTQAWFEQDATDAPLAGAAIADEEIASPACCAPHPMYPRAQQALPGAERFSRAQAGDLLRCNIRRKSDSRRCRGSAIITS
jgi:hypothetical protein